MEVPLVNRKGGTIVQGMWNTAGKEGIFLYMRKDSLFFDVPHEKHNEIVLGFCYNIF